MKNLILILFIFCCIFPECSNGKDKISPEGELLSMVFQADGKNFLATIDHSSRTVSVGGITNTAQISGVSYQLSDGAVITPDPQGLIGHWGQDQRFEITASDGKINIYTVHLKDLEQEAETNQVIIGYLPASDWEYDTEFANIRWEYLTHINVSFLYVNAQGELLDGSVKEHLEEIRDVAHRHGVKVLISLQSDGQKGFATAIQTDAVRKKLASGAVQYVRDHKLDGIDVDFEIYDAVGPNLLAFVKELHAQKGQDMLQTCAVATWNAGQGYSTEWHRYFDYINLMAYDFTGGWAQEGQHASMEQSVGLINLWLTTLQAPASKLVLGLPFYGYSWDDVPGVDGVKAIRYHQILTNYPGQDVENLDQVGRTYYNGKPTLIKKCQYVEEHGLAGVMIWQLFQDAKTETGSLLKTIGNEMKN